jgi:hypothetical protein
MKLPCFLRTRGFRMFASTLPLLLLTGTPSHLAAQEPSNVVMTVPLQASAGAPLLISADLLRGDDVETVYLLYRGPGNSQYTRLEMDLRGTRASTLVPLADVLPPFLEYYLVLRMRSGSLQTHPLSSATDPFSSPPENPLRIPIRPAEEGGEQALLLSPDPALPVPPEDLVISISLLRSDSLVNRKATRLLVDGADVTAEAVFADDIVVYVPENFSRRLAPGRHQVTIELFSSDGSLYRSLSYLFTVRGQAETQGEEEGARTRYQLSLQLESRHERVGGTATWYNRGGMQFTGTTGILSIRSNAFVTSDEHSDRQPQNRFFIGASIPWLSAGYGDSYPAFSNLILNGRRVRGLHSSASLGGFKLEVALGQTERPVDGRLLKEIPIDSLAREQAIDPTAAFAPLSATTWGKFSNGTYERRLFAIRPSIGSGRTWRLGFTWLKAKDELTSIRFGSRPQENLVLGSDFVARMFGEAVEIFGEGAFSAFNTDISSGSFTDAYIDSVYPRDAASIKQARDILDRFITVNDNLRPLSLKTLSTAAYEFGAGLNVLNQSLLVTWMYRGSEYHSFGQSFLRKDLKGLSAVDRIRILDNQVFLSLAYERLKDNTSKTKPATTTFTTVDASLSYYPRTSLPSFTVGFGHLNNSNGLPTSGNDSLRVVSAIDELGNRFFLQSSYTFVTAAQHTLTASYALSRRDDRSIRAFDVNDQSASFGITTLFSPPFQIAAEFAHSRSERPSGAAGLLQPFTYSTMTFSVRYGLVPDVVSLRGVVSPTYGDVQRTLMGAGVDWAVLPSMTLLFEFSRFKAEGGPDDSILDLRYRYDL